MIKMIFEGGYIYNMTAGEYKTLIWLAGIGAIAVMSIVLFLGALLMRELRNVINNKRA